MEYCNPINLDYKFQHYGKAAHREAADPTLILWGGTYFLFASMSAGFYYSKDLAAWKWHENRNLELYRYAPDVREHNGYLYFCASGRETMRIWRTKNPFAEHYEEVSAPFAFWDPNLLFDDDGRVYFFWGCGNYEPLWGVELDGKSFMPVGKKVAVICENSQEHGFERFNFPGKEKKVADGTFFEKAFMKFVNSRGKAYMEGMYCNKWNGKYYLQYAAPATEEPIYSDGVYISDHPLGPYEYQKHNPFSFKPAGFINGAGHGSTISDKHDNLWHAASMRISVNANFERRIGIFPAGFDKDGILYCNQNFADYPYSIPDGRFDAQSISPRYMLLSYKKEVKASSELDKHTAEFAVNEDIRNWWCAKGGAGEWIEVDLGKTYAIHSAQVNFAENEIPFITVPDSQRSTSVTGRRYIDSGRDLHTRYILEGSADGKNWFLLKDASKVDGDKTHDYIIFEEGKALRYIRLTAVELAYGQNFAVSGLRAFGLDDGQKASPVEKADIHFNDAMTAYLKWDKADNAVGYNVRYGINRNKLYSSHLVYEKSEVLLTALNKGQEYYCTVDSFNESGVTEGAVFRL
jgi:hypothetical protein